MVIRMIAKHLPPEQAFLFNENQTLGILPSVLGSRLTHMLRVPMCAKAPLGIICLITLHWLASFLSPPAPQLAKTHSAFPSLKTSFLFVCFVSQRYFLQEFKKSKGREKS